LLAGKITLIDYQLLVFYKLTNIRLLHPVIADRNLTYEQRLSKYDNIFRACQTINFMFPGGIQKPVFEYTCTINQLPIIRIKHEYWHSPSNALLDISFGEYRMAYDLYRQYLLDSSQEACRRLLAVLYRPILKNTGRRKSFDPDECLHRSKQTMRLPSEILFYVVTWFGACDRYLKTENIFVEGHEINLSCLFTNSDDDKKIGEDNLGLLGIELALAESGTFGDLDGVDRANLYTVLLKLYQWKKENDKTKAVYDKNSHT
jgi:hypothetical protein